MEDFLKRRALKRLVTKKHVSFFSFPRLWAFTQARALF